MKKSIWLVTLLLVQLFLGCTEIELFSSTETTGDEPAYSYNGDNNGDDNDYNSNLAAPTNVTATAQSSSSIRISWSSVSGADKYYIYRSTSSSGTYSMVSSSYYTYYTDTGLSSGKKYYYKVKAYKSGTYSSYSYYDYATTETTVSNKTRVCFYLTNSSADSYVKIYVDGSYKGQLTKYWTSGTPSYGDPGTISFEISSGSHSFTANDASSMSWSNTFYVSEGTTKFMKLQ